MATLASPAGGGWMHWSRGWRYLPGKRRPSSIIPIFSGVFAKQSCRQAMKALWKP